MNIFFLIQLAKPKRDQDCNEPCINHDSTVTILEDLSDMNVLELNPEVKELQLKVSQSISCNNT